MLSRPDWRHRAASCLRFIATDMRQADGRIAHAWLGGRISAAGLLDDQAATARAALMLFEATSEPEWIALAVDLAEIAERWFGDGAGGFFTTASDASDVPLARPRIVADTAVPSGNGLMAEVLARLFLLTGDERWRRRAEAVLRAFAGAGDQFVAMPTLLAAADLVANGATTVVVGPARHALTQALLAAARASPDPAIAVLHTADAAMLPREHPAHGKSAGPSGAAAFVCRSDVCGRPTGDPAELRAELRSATAAGSRLGKARLDSPRLDSTGA